MQLIANISERYADGDAGGLNIRAEITGATGGWLLSVVVRRDGHRLVAGLWVADRHPDSEQLISRRLDSMVADAQRYAQSEQACQHIRMARHAIESRCTRRARIGEPCLSATQLRTATALLGSGLHAPLQVRDVAASCGISEGHLRKGFRSCTGLSPQQWRQNERLKFCRQQLLETNAALALIAKGAGFPVPNYFSRVFTQSSGLPPSDWRRIFRSAMVGRSVLQSPRPALAAGDR